MIIAPFPGFEISEFPYTFIAIIFALTLEPQGRLKGALISV